MQIHITFSTLFALVQAFQMDSISKKNTTITADDIYKITNYNSPEIIDIKEKAKLNNSGLEAIIRDNCPWSFRLKQEFERKGLKGNLVNATYMDKAYDTNLVKTIRKAEKTFPLVFFDGYYIGGYTGNMGVNGNLEKLLRIKNNQNKEGVKTELAI
ncbi:hypothetical protein GINT2_002091 [Glugoides intestinalis]